MSKDIIRIEVKKLFVNSDHYNLLEYKESIGDNF